MSLSISPSEKFLESALDSPRNAKAVEEMLTSGYKPEIQHIHDVLKGPSHKIAYQVVNLLLTREFLAQQPYHTQYDFLWNTLQRGHHTKAGELLKSRLPSENLKEMTEDLEAGQRLASVTRLISQPSPQ